MTSRTLTHGVHALPQHSSASGRAGGASASAFLMICFVRKGVRRSRLPYAATCARISASLLVAWDAFLERPGGSPADSLSRAIVDATISPRRVARDESISDKSCSRTSRAKRGKRCTTRQRVRSDASHRKRRGRGTGTAGTVDEGPRWERSKSGPGHSGTGFFLSGRQQR